MLPRVEGRRQVQAFDTADVDFSTSGWLYRVLDVVPWLNLDASFDPIDLPKAVALRLFDELSSGKSEESFQVDGVPPASLHELSPQPL